SKEVASGTGMLAAAPACLQDARVVEDADATAGLAGSGGAGTGPEAGAKAEFGDVDEAMVIDEDLARASQVGPFGHEVAGGRKKLDAAIFAVGDVDGADLIDGDAVRNLKLSGVGAR